MTIKMIFEKAHQLSGDEYSM